jgi:hypothetical protein
MQILFSKTIEECRKLGARGGRAYGRNLRIRRSQAPIPPVAQLSTPPSQTAHQASLRLDAQFPWLAGAFAHRPARNLRPGVASGELLGLLPRCDGPCGSSARERPHRQRFSITRNCKPSKPTAAESKSQ